MKVWEVAQLRDVFLHSNQINRITGIAHLTNLEVLWLSNNEIHTVEGLGDLPLKELSLAQNPISQLGEVLNMKSLEFLNVASTDIGSFKVVFILNLPNAFLVHQAASNLLLRVSSLVISDLTLNSMLVDFRKLTRLTNLKDLRVSDPQWGDSPLALLHNYQV